VRRLTGDEHLSGEFATTWPEYDLDARTPLLSLTAERFHEARERLGEEVDHVEAVKMVEQENGIEIR